MAAQEGAHTQYTLDCKQADADHLATTEKAARNRARVEGLKLKGGNVADENVELRIWVADWRQIRVDEVAGVVEAHSQQRALQGGREVVLRDVGVAVVHLDADALEAGENGGGCTPGG